jgi:hypothetical protein
MAFQSGARGIFVGAALAATLAAPFALRAMRGARAGWVASAPDTHLPASVPPAPPHQRFPHTTYASPSGLAKEGDAPRGPEPVAESREAMTRTELVRLAANERARSRGLADAASALRPSVAVMEQEGQPAEAIEVVLRRIDDLEAKAAELGRKGDEDQARAR